MGVCKSDEDNENKSEFDPRGIHQWARIIAEIGDVDEFQLPAQDADNVREVIAPYGRVGLCLSRTPEAAPLNGSEVLF